jgi:hypothetical protein
LGHRRRLALDEADAAGRAAGGAAAGVQLVRPGILDHRLDEPFSGRDFEIASPYYGQSWHAGGSWVIGWW